MLGAKLGITDKQYNIVTNGLILYYEPSFNKCYPSGSDLYNLASGSLTPTGSIITDATVVGFSGNNGGYLSFDGTDGYIKGEADSSAPFTALGDATFVMWARPGGNNLNNYDCFISGRDGATTADYVTGITIDLGNGIGAGSWDQTNVEGKFNGAWQDLMTSDIAWDTWTHLTAIIENGVEIKLYVNGTAEGTDTATSTFNINYLQIGARYYGGVSGYIDSDIANLLIYNRVLSANEVTQNYNATKDRYTN